MFRLASLIYTMAAPVLAGIFVLVPLSAPKLIESYGYTLTHGMIGGAGLGAILGIPAAFIIAAAIRSSTRRD